MLIMTYWEMRPSRFHGISSSQKDLREFPKEVRSMVGVALYEAQIGRKPDDAKPLKGLGGAGVLEVVANHDGDAYRAVYTVRFAEAIYVLHCFQKKIQIPHRHPQRRDGSSKKPPQIGRKGI